MATTESVASGQLNPLDQWWVDEWRVMSASIPGDMNPGLTWNKSKFEIPYDDGSKERIPKANLYCDWTPKTIRMEDYGRGSARQFSAMVADVARQGPHKLTLVSSGITSATQSDASIALIFEPLSLGLGGPSTARAVRDYS